MQPQFRQTEEEVRAIIQEAATDVYSSALQRQLGTNNNSVGGLSSLGSLPISESLTSEILGDPMER